jgi:hypothetical protein
VKEGPIFIFQIITELKSIAEAATVSTSGKKCGELRYSDLSKWKNHIKRHMKNDQSLQRKGKWNRTLCGNLEVQLS